MESKKLIQIILSLSNQKILKNMDNKRKATTTLVPKGPNTPKTKRFK